MPAQYREGHESATQRAAVVEAATEGKALHTARIVVRESLDSLCSELHAMSSDTQRVPTDVGRRQNGVRGNARDELPDLLRPRKTPLSLGWRVLYLGGALLLAVCGVLGWLIPIITGIPFYIAAVVLAGSASDAVRRYINGLERRLPAGFRVRLRRVQRYWVKRKNRLRARCGYRPGSERQTSE